MLDYAALLALHTVIREGSFERAARRLHVTPSAVSQRIRALEERVGCALVVRDQPCRATDAGQRLCRHVDQVRLLELELEGAIPSLLPGDDAGGKDTVRVPLPIAVNADSLATWFAPAIADFGARHPVLLDVAVDNEDHTARWLQDGQVMAAVTASARAPAGCETRPLGAMRYLAAASPAFVARYFADGVTAAALARAPSLAFNAKDTWQERWAERLVGRRVALPHHTLPSPLAFVDASLAGMGWGMHPRELIAPCLADGTLVELAPGTPLDVALHWQYARSSAGLLAELGAAIVAAAGATLIVPGPMPDPARRPQ